MATYPKSISEKLEELTSIANSPITIAYDEQGKEWVLQFTKETMTRPTLINVRSHKSIHDAITRAHKSYWKANS